MSHNYKTELEKNEEKESNNAWIVEWINFSSKHPTSDTILSQNDLMFKIYSYPNSITRYFTFK